MLDLQQLAENTVGFSAYLTVVCSSNRLFIYVFLVLFNVYFLVCVKIIALLKATIWWRRIPWIAWQ